MTMIHQNQVQYDRSHWVLEGLLIASPGAGTLSSSEQFFTGLEWTGPHYHNPPSADWIPVKVRSF